MPIVASSFGGSRFGKRFPTPLIAILGPALGGAFMIPHAWIGTLLWFGLFQNLRHAAFALIGIAVAESFSRLFDIPDDSPIDGSLKANALLATVAVAWLTGPIPIAIEIQMALAVVAALAATITAAAITKTMEGSGLPSLALSYCFVATMLFAVFPDWTYAATMATVWWPVPTDILGWVITFFRTLGALLFFPSLTVGIVISAAVLLWSRTAFLAGVVGWVSGIAVAISLSELGVIYYWMPTAYNFFLSGMALGAVFFLPGRASIPMAALGGCFTSLIAVELQHLLPTSGFGYLPFASILTIWIRTLALSLAANQTLLQRNRLLNIPPEEAWWRSAYWLQRSGREGPFLVVPVSGLAQISQGADGELSHVGPWRYALDFQRPNFGTRKLVDEAAIWDAPVTAPAAGIVERMNNDIPDNPLGICNYAESWGNYVIIRLDQGGFAMLAHLRQGSIIVRPGMRVEIGALIGTVGNSGRSPVPHLHMQVQASSEPGAPTLPFRLANFLSANDAQSPPLQWHSAALPGQGAVIAAALPNPSAHSILTSMAPGTAIWSIESDGILPMPLRAIGSSTTQRVSISLNAMGQHIFKDAKGGALTSRLDPDAWRVLELQSDASPFLKLLALAAPSVPYAAVAGLTWEEPAPLVAFGMARWLGLSLSPYLPNPFPRVRSRCIAAAPEQDGPLTIETHLETPWSWLPHRLTCQFDRLRGPIRLEAQFRRSTLTCSVLSFEPGLPFGDRER